MSLNDTDNLKLIKKIDRKPINQIKLDDQIKCETNQMAINYPPGPQGLPKQHSGHSLHCVNRNLTTNNLSTTYPVNNQLNSNNYLNKKEQQLNRPNQFYHHPTHIHQNFHQTPDANSVFNQNIHYLHHHPHPHQFYYLHNRTHNQPKFTGSTHQCQFQAAASNAAAQMQQQQLNHSHSGSINQSNLTPNCNLINQQDNIVNTFQQAQPNQLTQQLSPQQHLHNNLVAEQQNCNLNYQHSNHYQSNPVNATAINHTSNRPNHTHHQSTLPKDKMNQQDQHNDWYKKTKKWETFPGRNKFYCDGRSKLKI